MSRRLVGGTLVAMSVLAANTGSFAASELPRALCPKSVLDTNGDAVPDHVGTGSPPSVLSSVNGLDLRAVTMRVTADHLEVYVKVESLPTQFDPLHTAYYYDLTFKRDPRVFRLQHLIPNTAQDQRIRPDNSQKYPLAHAGTGSTYNVTLEGSTAEVDQPNAYIIVRVPRAQVEKALDDEKLTEGAEFSDIKAVTKLYYSTRPVNADTTSVPVEAAKYKVGDDYCFGPPPATLSDFTSAPVQFGDATKLTAKLADEAGAALAGKQVQFAVAGESKVLTGTTDAQGVASVTYVPTRAAGTAPVTVTFAREETIGAAKLTGSVVVKAEVTKFNPFAVARTSSTGRAVTATLVDDDKRAVTGQKVDWYVNGKKAATVATDSKGRSVYKGAKSGQTVQAKFAGLAGKYAGSASKSQKV